MRITTLAVGPIQTNCYIVADGTSGLATVIDPGAEAGKILAFLEEQALTPDTVLLTHGHFDHTGAVEKLRQAGATLAAYTDLETREGFQPDTPLEEGSEVVVGSLVFKVLHTPGHTRDSVCYQIGGALFTGDTLFEGDCGRTDLPGGSYPVILRSLARLAKLDGDFDVYPGHDVSTTLEAERTGNRNMLEALRAHRD
jgi:glyoxylase-like metal-dependent hydrolase (beta-lactamase superfamily II)